MIPQFLKPIPGYSGYRITEYGKVWSEVSQRFLQARQVGDNYLGYNLLGHQCYAHRLVAKAWLPNPNNLPVVHHKDSNRQNNHYSNLEWCTYQHNTRQSPILKFSDEDVAEIRRLYSTGIYTQQELADMFGVSARHVGHIVNNETRG